MRTTATTDRHGASPSGTQAGDRTFHILIVDDEKAIVELLRLLLEDEGFHVTGETSAATALQAVRRQPPDLIITDVMMPGMTGYELARAATAIDPNVNVIFMSAVVDRAHHSHHPFLVKPFDLTTVIEAVEAELRAS